MEIMFADIWILYFQILVFLIILLKNSNFFNIKQYNEDFLSKENSNIIKGIAVIMIFLSHTAQRVCFNDKATMFFYYIFLHAGLLGVVIFLFISGYGLVIQYQKNNSYLNKFFIKKHLRIYIIFLLANIITTILSNTFLESSYEIKDIFISSLFLRFSTGRELWFIVIIFYYYFVFYFSFKFLNLKYAAVVTSFSVIPYILACIVLKKGTWWYNTAICFPIGIVFSLNRQFIYCFFKKYYLSILIFISTLFLVCMTLFEIVYIQSLQFIIPIIFIILVVLLLIKINLNAKTINFMNNISLEFYLLHGIILDIIFKVKEVRSSIYVIITFIISIILSKLLNTVIKIIFNN